MRRPLSAREERFVAIAGELADDFAERAALHDRDASFPFENYDRMQHAGYLGLTIPEELGGLGASLSEMLIAQERLAMGCAATALAVTMHVSPLGQLATLWRRSRDPGLEDFLREAATGQIIYASMSAERGHSILMTSNTLATRVEGGYRVSGDKIFGTESSICTHFSTMGRLDDPQLGSRVMFFRLPRDVEGMTVKDNWDTLGMRATQSNDYTLTDVFVPESAVFHSYPVGHFDALMLRTVWAWAMPAFGSVYLGIAAGAMRLARDQAVARHRHEDSQVQQLFAEMEVLLETARAVLARHARDVETDALVLPRLSHGAAVSRCPRGNHHAVQQPRGARSLRADVGRTDNRAGDTTRGVWSAERAAARPRRLTACPRGAPRPGSAREQPAVGVDRRARDVSGVAEASPSQQEPPLLPLSARTI